MDRARWTLRRGLVVALIASCASLHAPRAFGASAADKAVAESLFDEGRKLLAAKKYAEACPKFAESQRLDPGIGTLYNLGDCYEHIGKTASAWATFREAAAAANAAGQVDRERVARDRATKLEPKLSRLSVVVTTGSAAPNLEVRRDGDEIDAALWGSALPIDPGSHTIEASAPGKKKWISTFVIVASATTTTVTIPPLEAADPSTATTATSTSATATSAPTTVPTTSPTTAPTVATAPTATTTTATTTSPTTASARPRDAGSDGSSQRIGGVILASVGGAAVVVGAIFGLKAKSKNDEASTFCRTPTLCQPDGVSLGSDAHSAATVSTIAFLAGGAAIAGGLILYVTAPSAARTAGRGDGLRLAIAPNASGIMLSMGGGW